VVCRDGRLVHYASGAISWREKAAR
jgi:hypothetical protein